MLPIRNADITTYRFTGFGIDDLPFFLQYGTDSLRKTGRAGFLLVFLSFLPILRVFIVVEHPVLPDGKIFIFPVCAATVFTGRYALA